MWLEDPNSPSGWTYRPSEPRAEATHILSRYAEGRRHELREPAVTDDRLVSYDPDEPHDPVQVDPVDRFRDGPVTWTGSDPATSRDDAMLSGYARLAEPSADLVCCPTCGAGVHPDRIGR